jgi:hypothetical protein
MYSTIAGLSHNPAGGARKAGGNRLKAVPVDFRKVIRIRYAALERATQLKMIIPPIREDIAVHAAALEVPVKWVMHRQAERSVAGSRVP